MKISLPPVVKSKEEEIIAALMKLTRWPKNAIVSQQTGCISFFDLALSNIISMACLCYVARPLDFIFQDFWEKNDEKEQKES